MAKESESGFFEHILQILSGRNGNIAFRVGENGHWHQLTGADFLADVDRVAEAFSADFSLPRQRGAAVRSSETSYPAAVYAVAAALLGWEIGFGAAGLPDAPLLPLASTLGLGLHRFGGRGSARPLRWLPEGAAMGRLRCMENDSGVDAVDFDRIAMATQRFLQMREVHQSRASRGRIRFLALTVPASAWFHISWMAAVLENGVCGFPDPQADWETNLRVLRPTLVTTGGRDVAMISDLVVQVSSRSRLLWNAERVMRGVGLLKTPLMRRALEDLKTVVLDSASADHSHERLLADTGLKILRLKSPLRNPLSTALLRP